MMLKPEDLPTPDTLVTYSDGSVSAVMFHYAPGGSSLKDIADENGFEVAFLGLTEDLASDHPLVIDYKNGADVIGEWQPTLPEGWQFGGKFDGDEGAFAIFIKKQEALSRAA
jgi:hypothetical protein